MTSPSPAAGIAERAIEPCPFCGGTVVPSAAFPEYTHCNVCLPELLLPIAAWNRRAVPALANRVKELEAALDRLVVTAEKLAGTNPEWATYESANIDYGDAVCRAKAALKDQSAAKRALESEQP